MPTYPSNTPSLTVGAYMKQPRLIVRDLTNLAANRYVGDRIFARGSSDQIAGGVAIYQQSESIFTSRDPEEVGVRSRYPRATWTEAIFTAVVRKYGLEHPIADETVRRNQIDQFTRAELKLANAMVKFVDAVAMAALLSDANVQTAAASGDWTTAATDIIADIANGRAAVQNYNEGYVIDTMIVNPAQELDLMLDQGIRDALPREGGGSAVQTGRPVPILGLRQILVTPGLTAGTVILTQMGIVGTIADEAPVAEERYQTYSPGAGAPGGPAAAPVYMKMYREEGTDETIVRSARFPAMWLAEPKSAFKITGA